MAKDSVNARAFSSTLHVHRVQLSPIFERLHEACVLSRILTKNDFVLKHSASELYGILSVLHESVDSALCLLEDV